MQVKFTIQEEYVKCGKPGCKSCPHGPYRYKYWREGGVLKKKYLGKPEDQALFDKEGEPAFKAQETAVPKTIHDFLSIPASSSFSKTRIAHRAYVRRHRGTSDQSVINLLNEELRLWNLYRGKRR